MLYLDKSGVPAFLKKEMDSTSSPKGGGNKNNS